MQKNSIMLGDMIGILTLIFVIALSMLITKIAAIALMQTGMERDRARFQARSAFTGTGFTTSESEMVMQHPVRRKIILSLLLLGNAGLVTAVSSLILGFSGPGTTLGRIEAFLFLVLGLFLLFLVTRSKRLDRILDKTINRFLAKHTDIRPKKFEKLLTVMKNFEIVEMDVEDNQWMIGQSLTQLRLTDEGILVLGVINKDEHYNGVPRGGYTVNADDRLVVYGHSDHIVSLSKREDKLQGREEHRKMKAKFEKERAEKPEESSPSASKT